MVKIVYPQKLNPSKIFPLYGIHTLYTLCLQISLCIHTWSCNYRIWQNFRLLKFPPKAHTVYWGKNFAKFNFANCASYLPGNSGWSSGVIGMHYVHMRVCSQSRVHKFNVSKFSLCKKIHEKNFRQQHALVKLVKIFSWQKFPHMPYKDKESHNASSLMLIIVQVFRLLCFLAIFRHWMAHSQQWDRLLQCRLTLR